MLVALGAPDIVAFTDSAFIILDGAGQNISLFHLNMFMQRQARIGFPAEQCRQKTRFLVLHQNFHIDTGHLGWLPGQIVHGHISGIKLSQLFLTGQTGRFNRHNFLHIPRLSAFLLTL